MARKILSVQIKTIDEKNHVEFHSANDVHLDSIKFKIDDKSTAKKQEKKEEPVKKTKKTKK